MYGQQGRMAPGAFDVDVERLAVVEISVESRGKDRPLLAVHVHFSWRGKRVATWRRSIAFHAQGSHKGAMIRMNLSVDVECSGNCSAKYIWASVLRHLVRSVNQDKVSAGG